MSFYKKIFSNVLNEAEDTLPMVDAKSDAEQFKNGFEDQSAYDQIENETQATAVPVQDLTATIEAAEKYSEIIKNKLLPFLNKLHNEFLDGGIFSNSGMTPPNMSSITTSLADLAQELPSKLKDVAAKEAHKNSKNK